MSGFIWKCVINYIIYLSNVHGRKPLLCHFDSNENNNCFLSVFYASWNTVTYMYNKKLLNRQYCFQIHFLIVINISTTISDEIFSILIFMCTIFIKHDSIKYPFYTFKIQNRISGAAFCIIHSWKLIWRYDYKIGKRLF